VSRLADDELGFNDDLLVFEVFRRSCELEGEFSDRLSKTAARNIHG
jgi:hypothetical protein